MSPEEILEHYPGAPDAVEHGESQNPSIWDEARRIGVSPTRMVELNMIGTTTAVVLRYTTLESMPVEVAGLIAKILDQMEHPDYLKYVAAKLGGM